MDDKPQQITLDFIRDITTREKRKVKFLGYDIVINKNVFPVDSPFSFSSEITARQIPNNAGAVLDVGTGTGAQAVVAAKRGASKVVAIDIDENCLKNAEENFKLNYLKNAEVRKSDLFNNIKKEEKFDLIISQLPLVDVSYKSPVSHFLFDSGFELHERFLKEAKFHLTSHGIIFITSGDIANEQKLLELIKKYSYSIVKVAEERFQGQVWKVYTLNYSI